MKEYFLLQHKMLNRKLIDFGTPPFLAYIIIPVAFVLLSSYLFLKTEFAGYVYVFLALSIIVKMSEPKRNDFLKSIFDKRKYLSVRVLENLIFSVPFLIFLAYQKLFLLTSLLGILTILIALFNFSINTSFTIPTPFGKRPFEFAVGFRKTFFVFPIAYFLTFMSIVTANFNLGVFSLIIVGLICISYYLKPENEYYVWSFNSSSKIFLLNKIKVCFVYFTLLSLPVALTLSVFFFENTLIIFGFLLLSYIYLSTVILAKYSAYPNEMNVPQGILIAISLMFPPLLLGVIPFFYSQSVKNLNLFLNDTN